MKPLVSDQIKDILVDIRCAYRDHPQDPDFEAYAVKCELQVLRLATTIDPVMDKYGWYS